MDRGGALGGAVLYGLRGAPVWTSLGLIGPAFFTRPLVDGSAVGVLANAVAHV